MDKKLEYISTKEWFTNFFFEPTNKGTLDNVASWAQKHLIDKNPNISKEEKSVFFTAGAGVDFFRNSTAAGNLCVDSVLESSRNIKHAAVLPSVSPTNSLPEASCERSPILEELFEKGAIRKFQDLLDAFDDVTEDYINLRKSSFKIFNDELKETREFVVKHVKDHESIERILDSCDIASETIYAVNRQLITVYDQLISLLGELSTSIHLLDLGEGSSAPE